MAADLDRRAEARDDVEMMCAVASEERKRLSLLQNPAAAICRAIGGAAPRLEMTAVARDVRVLEVDARSRLASEVKSDAEDEREDGNRKTPEGTTEGSRGKLRSSAATGCRNPEKNEHHTRHANPRRVIQRG